MHLRLISETKNFESLKREISSACLVFSHRAPKTTLDPAEMSLGWRRELFGKERALQGRHAVSKPEVGEVIEMKNKDE